MGTRPTTAKSKERFIKALREFGGNVFRAAKLVKLSRTALYNYRKEDPEFAEAWDNALEDGFDDLEAEARRRALEGYDEPVYHGGEQVGFVRRYSDTLLIFLLKGARPEKYRERYDVKNKVQGSLNISIENAIDNLYDGSSSE